MTPEQSILFWWVMFGVTHVVGSSVPVRRVLIGKVGLKGFKGLYTLVSFATFVPLVYVFFTNRGAGEMLFQPAPWFRYVTEALMVLAFIAFAQAAAMPNPMTTLADLSGQYPSSPRGIQRVTRHPSGLAFTLFAAAHMLSNPYVGDWIFFGGFVVFVAISTLHQDRRTLASGHGEINQFQAETSAIPFLAILSGKQRLALREYSIGAVVIAVVLAAVLWYFHPTIFGGYA